MNVTANVAMTNMLIAKVPCWVIRHIDKYVVFGFSVSTSKQMKN
jgi:hypothetical protein